MKKIFFYCIVLITGMNSCSSTKRSVGSDDGKINITFVQVNDVYEIAPLSGGTEGGMARVATIKKKYKVNNPNTFLVMAGDFLSPSVYNSLKYEGKAIRGRQMVESMNAAGMDLVVFGNHEFDIKENELQERIEESTFQWISSNSFHKQQDKVMPFTKAGVAFPITYIKTVRDADGTTARIGFIGLTLPFNKAPYVSYTDAISTAKKLYNEIKDSVDAVVAITHQSLEEDEMLAREIPGLTVILGGHEHDQRFAKIGNIYITKALANAKSAYIVKLHINKNKHSVKVKTKLQLLNEEVAIDSAANIVVQKWSTIAANSYASLGFDAKREVLKNSEPLDGRESEIRSHPTNLTRLIVSAMQAATPQAEVVIMNAGSIRVDDILQMPVTEYDIIRALPFGGGVKDVNIKGAMLSRILDVGSKNKGTGGYLQYNENIHFDVATNKWMLNNIAIDPSRNYRVSFSEFLLTGGEANLDFLNMSNKEITSVTDADAAQANLKSDIRRVIIEYLKKKN